jgi:hypothetical protein
MRKTRPQDYDPNFKQTKAPKPEEIDVGDVVPMKERSPIATAQQSESMVDIRPERTERPVRNERTERSERNQRPVRPQKRQIIRHSFDIYIDQLEELRSLKVEAMRRGEERGLAKMTREALEEYLKRQR